MQIIASKVHAVHKVRSDARIMGMLIFCRDSDVSRSRKKMSSIVVTYSVLDDV